MSQDDRAKLILSGAAPDFEQAVDGTEYIVLGEGAVYDRRTREPVELVGGDLDTYKTWVSKKMDQLLVEMFPRGERHYLVCYPFEGRLAHQTLGMLLTRRLERTGLKPLGFVASEYALAVWAMEDMRGENLDQLFHEDMLGDDLDAWLDESALMKRTFRTNALISGLIERRMPKHEKTGRQITFSTDLIYDVLRSHEPDHILLQAARQDAGDGLLDIRRLGEALKRFRGKIVHAKLEQISPFAVPVMLEMGKEPVFSGDAAEAILREAEDDLVRDAMS
jgi:ATP-dependent Lhr-like helicase